MAKNENLLPIKRVVAAKNDYRKNLPGGGGFAPLVDVDEAFVEARVDEISKVEQGLKESAEDWPDAPTVAVVKLRQDAIAKSKRPSEIFNSNTCPIIGGSGLGMLYVSVTKRGLENLKRVVSSATGSAVSHLSTIESMRPYSRSDVLGDTSLARISRHAEKKPLRLIMFRHNDQALDRNLQSGLRRVEKETSSKLRPLQYARDIDVFEFAPKGSAAVASMASFP